ncbi:hypothetical protein [Scytonema sp. UIC 10036]|uniref:hypothetical protein n=1 Tax=Scytonema sp. UIC 10036 TaxID=2304196 RepID=UPI001FAA4954|nr:hypothetical protein [Scytonema sp. UIC 10036]
MSTTIFDSSEDNSKRSTLERLEARVSKEQKELFQRATDIQITMFIAILGKTPNFLVVD